MASGVLHKFTEFCQSNSLITPRDKIVIGVSGGPDSLCLLHLFITISQKFELTLTVAHLNHQLRGADAQADAAFVQEIAEQWQLPCFIEKHNIASLANKRKQSIEEAARQVRYAFLWRVAVETDSQKIAVGHNADDQVETVLMHFLRGTGLTGLRGILPETDLASLRLHPEDIPEPSRRSSPKLIRPLLDISRVEIEAYCQDHNLSPRQDYSNQDITFFRNRLRYELLPLLETYNPNLRQVLQHTAKVVTADTQILNDELEKAWNLVIIDTSPERIVFDLQSWLSLPLGLKRSVLRQAVQTLCRSLRDISFRHIENAIAILDKGKTGAKATLPQELILTVGYQIFTMALKNASSQPLDFNQPQLLKDQILQLKLPGVTPLIHTNWQLKADLLPYQSLNLQEAKRVDRWEVYLDADVVGDQAFLRSRRPGDTFYPLGMVGHRKKINDFMINEKIPADWRDHIPLLVSADRILWVCGHRPDERACLHADTQQLLHLKFEPV